MSEIHYGTSWLRLPNPFYRIKTKPLSPVLEGAISKGEFITGYVSGRSTDITEIIIGGQSAIILAGSPHIGKSTLIQYLEESSNSWSWRNELASLGDRLDLDAIHFAQVDLTPLETETMEDWSATFQRQCAVAVQSAYHEAGHSYTCDLAGLRQQLRQAQRENPQARYFVMFDAIERLARQTKQSVNTDDRIERDQDKGLALLQQCGALRTLLDLNDEFLNFGIILSIETQPRPSIGHQFSRISKHISNDLARFTTMMLKTFSWEDAIQFLKQEPGSFGTTWAEHFSALQGTTIFSHEEQDWLLEQAGTHPYLLQQFRFYTFYYKQKYAEVHKVWPILEDTDKRQIADTVKERLSTFLANIWNRLQQALEQSQQETSKQFYDLLLMPGIQANQEIADAVWNKQGIELRYILENEGIVCYDMLRHVRYPGSVFLNYLIQEAQRSSERAMSDMALTSSPATRGIWFTYSGSKPERLDLSDLEYRLLQTLLQHPEACTENMLMEGAWGREIERSAFTQRMYHLRKKLKKLCGETEIIENRYGGQYVLNHPEWFRLV